MRAFRNLSDFLGRASIFYSRREFFESGQVCPEIDCDQSGYLWVFYLLLAIMDFSLIGYIFIRAVNIFLKPAKLRGNESISLYRDSIPKGQLYASGETFRSLLKVFFCQANYSDAAK